MPLYSFHRVRPVCCLSRAGQMLSALSQELPRLTAILVISAHWETGGFIGVAAIAQPVTIHDFSGFPDALYDIR